MENASPQTAAPAGEQASYYLCAKRQGMRLKLAEVTLTLSDDGISYAIDGQTHDWPFSRLYSIRLQAVPGGRNAPWEAMICLYFGAGHFLYVSSASAWGNDDKSRDRSFIAFVEDLHRRLSPDDISRIRFMRGLDDTGHKVIVAAGILFAIMFGGGGLFILFQMLQGKIPVLQGLIPIAGILGMGFWLQSIATRNRRGSYDPRRLPRELYPEQALP